MPKDLGPSTLDDPATKAGIIQAIKSGEGSSFGGDLEKALSLPSGDFEAPSKPLTALQTMLRNENLRPLREGAHESPLRAFRALWHSGMFSDARRFADESDLGIKVPSSPSSLVRVGGPMASTEPEEAGVADAEAMSEFGIWGASEQALRIMYEVLILGSKPRVLHYDALLTGPTGTEKLNIAQALHALRQRGHFEVLDCSDLHSEPGEILGRCVGGGTVFIRGLESASAELGSSIYQAVVPSHNSKSNLCQSINNTQFILDVSERDLPGLVGAFCRQGKWDEMWIPPLSERMCDIPLLVNRALLDLVVPTHLDSSRHLLASALWRFYEDHRPAGEIAWLRSEVGRWVRMFSPSDAMSEQVAAILEPSSTVDAEEITSRKATGKQTGRIRDERHQTRVESWKDVTVTFTSANTAKITSGDTVLVRGHFSGLGFADRRTEEKPVRSWHLLKRLATHGEIAHDDPSFNFKKAVQELKKKLKRLVCVDESPIQYDRKSKCWRPNFTVIDDTRGGQGGGLQGTSVSIEDVAEEEQQAHLTETAYEALMPERPARSTRAKSADDE